MIRAAVRPVPPFRAADSRTRPRFLVAAGALALALFVPLVRVAFAETYVFVSAATDRRILVFTFDSERVELTLRQRVPLGGEPSALVLAPDRRHLFVAYRSTGQLASLRVAPGPEPLRLVNVVDAGEDPAHLTVDSTSSYLLAAYYVAAKVSVHKIDADGRLGERPHQELATADKAHAIRFDPSEKYAFAPHTGTNRIEQFLWDRATGKLARNAAGPIELPANTGPRHLDWHPRLGLAIVDNEQASSITSYRLDSDAGILRAETTLPTIPADFSGVNACAEVRVHRSGRFVYASNRGHDSLAGFAIDARGGLRSLGTFPTERTPRSFDFTPDGRFLIAAGESSGAVQIYQVDGETGRLEPRRRQDVAPRAWWVLAADLPAP